MQSQSEVEIKEVIHYLLAKKWAIGLVTLSGLLLGVLIALTTPRKYEVNISFLNEQRSSSGLSNPGFAGLAGLAGISLPNINNTLSPGIYPEIIGSSTFVEEVREMEFLTVTREKISLLTFLQEHQKSSFISKIFGLPAAIFSVFSDKEEKVDTNEEIIPLNKQWIFLDKEYVALSSHLENSLEINNSSSDVIEIVATHQDPYIAGALAEHAYNFLTEYIAGYELSKETKKLEFTENQLEKVRARFLEAQNKLARFRDSNVNIISAQAKSEEERLQADYNIAFNVFNAIMVQKEEAQLKLEDNIPAFTIIEKIKIPEKPSWPNKKLIVAITIFVSFFLAIIYFLIVFFVKRLELKPY